jgi:hypothetical protein
MSGTAANRGADYLCDSNTSAGPTTIAGLTAL